MGKNLGTKAALVIAILLFFAYGILGVPHSDGHGFVSSVKQSLADRIHLGLDLKGGTHLVLAVHVEEALAGETDRDAAAIKTAVLAVAPTATIGKTDPQHPNTIVISGVPAPLTSQVRGLVSTNQYSAYAINTGADGSLRLAMTPAAIETANTRTLDQTIEVVSDRINVLGVKETTVQKYGLGDNEILVEVPGEGDPDKIAKVINSASKLAIFAVDGGPYADDQAALAAQPAGIPPDDQLLHGQGSAAAPDQVWLLKRAAEVEGTDFRDAQPSTDINGRPNLRFTLTTEAGERFFQYTDSHKAGSPTPGQMAIVLGSTVKEVAGIQSGIRDQGEITGSFTQDEVANLSKLLRTGSLPASITNLETRTVGPSLGAASIRQGVVAAIAGMSAVMLFMLIYYKGSGINADIALLLNLIILLGFMGYSGAVLTLPGIAGVILTIGMGVDSNVLIFERIREELRAGKTAAAAVKEGFGHAWITIVDTHVTTIVSAVILLMFGTGPVKGFAVTLMVGLFANLITAVFISRMIFDWHLQGKDRAYALSI